jgi:hypothetical protein
MGKRSTSELAEKLSIRIRVCLQAPEFTESSRFVSGYAFRLPNLRKALGSYQGMPSGSRICGKLSVRIRVCLQAPEFAESSRFVSGYAFRHTVTR